MEMHDPFASIENPEKTIRNAISDEAPALPGTMIVLDRCGLSCRSQQAIRMCPTASYFQLSIYRIRPGTDSDFADLVRLRRQRLDSINLNRPDLACQVISGAELRT